jgi:hypothetical protein
MIILVDCIFPIHWPNRQEVAWFVLLTAWRLNHGPVDIATVPTEMLVGAFNLPQDGGHRIEVIDLIPDGMGVFAHSIVPLVMGFVRKLPHI